MSWLMQAASLGAERDAYSPATYKGYGNCLGTTNSGLLNWGVYYFRRQEVHVKWSSLPIHPSTVLAAAAKCAR